MSRARTRTARIGILTVIPEEFDAVWNAFGSLEEIVPGSWSPNVADCEIVVEQSADRGTAGAQAAAGKMLEHFQPEILALVGIAGGIVRGDAADEPHLGDVVVASYVHYSEYMKFVPGAHLRRYAAYDQPSAPLRLCHSEAIRRMGLGRGFARKA